MSQETTHSLGQLGTDLRLARDQEESKGEKKVQTVTTNPDNFQVVHEKMIGDYVREGLTTKLNELSKENKDLDSPLLEQSLTLLTKDFDQVINMKAIARLTSPRPPFIPTKIIAMFIANNDYSTLRRLLDFKSIKNIEQVNYDL